MRNRIIIGSSLVLLLFVSMIPMAEAVEWQWGCEDGNLVGRTSVTASKNDGTATTYIIYDINQTAGCAYGCDNVTNSCMPALYEQNMLILALALIGLVVTAFIIKKVM